MSRPAAAQRPASARILPALSKPSGWSSASRRRGCSAGSEKFLIGNHRIISSKQSVQHRVGSTRNNREHCCHAGRPESVIARLRNRLVASLCTAVAPGSYKFLNRESPSISSMQGVQQRMGLVGGDRARRRGVKRSGITPRIVEMRIACEFDCRKGFPRNLSRRRFE